MHYSFVASTSPIFRTIAEHDKHYTLTCMALARTNNYAVLFNTIEHANYSLAGLGARTALYRTIHLRGYS